MNRDQFRDELESWLEEGPAAAPHDLIGAIITDFPTAGRRRTLLGQGRRLLARGLAVAGVAAAAALVTMALTARGPAQVGRPTAQPTPGWAERFPERLAADFVRPFTYAIDPASGLALSGGGVPSETVAFTNPEAGATGASSGITPAVVVRTVGRGILVDPCHSSGGGVRLVQTPDQFVAALATTPGLVVTDTGVATVDGRSARSADVLLDDQRSCDTIWVFDDTCRCPFSSSTLDLTERRMTAFEVDGDLIVVVTLASRDGFDTWLPTADAFIDTIHFRN